MKENFVAYITTRKIDHYLIPPPLQIMLIREYCKNNEILFSLPAEELIFDNCYLELQTIISGSADIKGVLMTSLFLLPKNKIKRNSILKNFIKNNIEVHFILESIVMEPKKSNRLIIEEIIDLNSLIKLNKKSTLKSVSSILALKDQSII